MTEKELIEKLTKIISIYFSKNVAAIIQIGSFDRKASLPFSDLDLIFIIKKPSEKLNIFLKKLFKEYQKPIDPSSIYLYKTKDPRILFGTHGYYMIDHLREGKVLFGRNPFIRKKLLFRQIQQELLSKIKEYLYERKKWYLTKNTNNIKEQYKLLHRLLKSILDLLIIDGTITNQESPHLDYHEIFRKALQKYPWTKFIYLKFKKIREWKSLNEKELSKLIFLFEKISYEANEKIFC